MATYLVRSLGSIIISERCTETLGWTTRESFDHRLFDPPMLGSGRLDTNADTILTRSSCTTCSWPATRTPHCYPTRRRFREGPEGRKSALGHGGNLVSNRSGMRQR